MPSGGQFWRAVDTTHILGPNPKIRSDHGSIRTSWWAAASDYGTDGISRHHEGAASPIVSGSSLERLLSHCRDS
jgi:hypothetical protein